MNGVSFMIFKIKNFGKIAEANIKLDGITVICGNNDTGKSTVGKALFSFFNALTDYKNKIDAHKNNILRTSIRNYASDPMDLPVKVLYPENSMEFISEHDNHLSLEEVKEFLELSYGVKLPKIDLFLLSINNNQLLVVANLVYLYYNINSWLFL